MTAVFNIDLEKVNRLHEEIDAGRLKHAGGDKCDKRPLFAECQVCRVEWIDRVFWETFYEPSFGKSP
jgi:hypothetical protein